MKYTSSRWVDTRKYKSKEILLKEVGKVTEVKPSNKKHTFYVCSCVFHSENTPSMKFFYNKYVGGWTYKCFGCGRSGDIFTFLMNYSKFEFWEILVYLRKRYVCNYSYIDNPNQIKIPFPYFE